MCVICVKRAGVPVPTKQQLKTMYDHNPHGAGFMFARGGKVEIRKGFMTFCDFLAAVNSYNFADADSVVYHFRISTQAGTTKGMTHPFPLTHYIGECKKLKCSCDCGVAHNGIIHLTSDPTEKTYSDTAIFIAEYLSWLIFNKEDMTDPTVLNDIYNLAQSKFALMWNDGTISTVGDFITEENGLQFSNYTYKTYDFPRRNFTSSNVKTYYEKNKLHRGCKN